MPDQIPEEIKQRRLDELMTIQQQISLERNKMRVGKTYEVLVEGFEGLTYYGRSMLEAPEIDGKIFFISDKELKPGEYVNVKITGAEEYDLQGVCRVNLPNRLTMMRVCMIPVYRRAYDGGRARVRGLSRCCCLRPHRLPTFWTGISRARAGWSRISASSWIQSRISCL